MGPGPGTRSQPTRSPHGPCRRHRLRTARAPRVSRLVVASVPAAHVYVRHLAPLGNHDDGVVRLPDPDPDHPERDDLVAGERWWPPVALAPGLARPPTTSTSCTCTSASTPPSPRGCAALLDVAAERRHRALVLTVHDLRSPHQDDPAALDAQLDVLVPAADAVLTLTPAAAAEVAARWGRDAEVRRPPARRRARHRGPAARGPPGAAAAPVPRGRPGREEPAHQHRPAAPAARPAGRRRGAPPCGAAGRPPTATSRPHRRDRAARRRRRPRAAAARRRHSGGVARPPHATRSSRTTSPRSTSSVLPYRFGTHSGWLEACHDVGTRGARPLARLLRRPGRRRRLRRRRGRRRRRLPRAR